MANSYSAFSVELELLSQEELDQARVLIDLFRLLMTEDLSDADAATLRSLFDSAVGDLPELTGECLFRIETTRSFPYSLYVWAEESADLLTAVTFIQAFLRMLNRDDIITLTWADWCSKPRPGEFGGGAVVISRTDVRWLDTQDWIDRTHDEMLAAQTALDGGSADAR